MKLELTNEEAQSLALLIDLAVKAQGVRVAEMAVTLIKKLEVAAKIEAEPQLALPALDDACATS